MNCAELCKALLDFFGNHVDVIKLVFAVVGGGFALFQWRIQIKHKRAEIVKELILKVRDDDDIAAIMDIIDWSEGLQYNGKFSLNKAYDKPLLANENEESLFRKIDKTLSHFSYICYLNNCKALTKKDLIPFEYELRRIVDNHHICDYLYSIYHWSHYLGVKCSFEYLINYYLKKKHLTKDFKTLESKTYKSYLRIPNKDQ